MQSSNSTSAQNFSSGFFDEPHLDHSNLSDAARSGGSKNIGTGKLSGRRENPKDSDLSKDPGRAADIQLEVLGFCLQ